MAARRRSVGRYIWRGSVGAVATLFACLSYTWATLPDVRPLQKQPPDRTAFMRLRETQARQDGREAPREHWQWRSYGRISPNLKRAVLVSEDAGFWGHDGVDTHELRVSLEASWARGSFTRGASTITQQLAKNLYLSPTRNPYRKATELMITRRLEAEVSKTRIFELYLNVVEWGDGIWGAEAASRAYFGRPASDLSRAQAALLAGALINPRVYSPMRPNARLLARQRIILRRMGPPPPESSTRPESVPAVAGDTVDDAPKSAPAPP